MKFVDPLPYTRPMQEFTQPSRPRVSLAYMLALSLSLHVALLMLLPATRVHEIRIDSPILARLAEPDPVPEPESSPLSAPSPTVPPPSEPSPQPANPMPVSEIAAEMPSKEHEPSTPRPVHDGPTSPPSPSPVATAPLAAIQTQPTLPASPHDAGTALPIDTTWYPPHQLDRPPRGVGAIHPEYPREARRQGIEGQVRLRLRIDEEGRVREAEVLEGQPAGVFDDSTLTAFKAAYYAPALRNGRPVRAEIEIRVVFRLD